MTARHPIRLTSSRSSSRLQLKPTQKLHLYNREICSNEWGQLSHPSRRPDYAASKNGAIVSYVEVTSFGPTQEAIASSNAEAVIYKAINSIQMPPGSCLSFEVVSRGTASPPVKPLCNEIGAWVGKVMKDQSSLGRECIFKAQDWSIEVALITGLSVDNQLRGAIGVSFNGPARMITPENSIKQAIEKKCNRYGAFEVPFVIAVADCKGELFGGEENDRVLLEAAFGNESLLVSMDDTGAARSRNIRLRNGFWGNPNTPKNQNVSAIVLEPIRK